MTFISNFNDVKDGYLCHLFKNIVIKWHIKEDELGFNCYFSTSDH